LSKVSVTRLSVNRPLLVPDRIETSDLLKMKIPE